MIDTIKTPTLLIDKNKCLTNIKKMLAKAERFGLVLRPHFKTHQSLKIGGWFKELGVEKIAVSSLDMAVYFADGGWEDITVAFPVNIREILTINQLASKIKLNLLVENTEAVSFLNKKLLAPVNIFIKADTGYNRTGITPENTRLIDEILAHLEASDKMTFKGFLGHAGHSYKARGKNEILEVHKSSLTIMQIFRKNYLTRFPGIEISYGDTPTCSVAQWFEGVTELRPGNFVFYDLAQVQIGSCSVDDVALVMACPIVAKHPERKELIIYGGGVHFSKDRVSLENGDLCFGQLVELKDQNWKVIEPSIYLKSVSQEHGIIQAPKEWIEKQEIGDLVFVLPVHSCMAMDLLREDRCLILNAR